MNEKKKRNMMEFMLIFALVYLLSQVVMRTFFPDKYDPNVAAKVNTLTPMDRTVKDGHHPILILRNNSEGTISVADACPMPPVNLFFVQQSASGEEELAPINSEENAVPCEAVGEVVAGGKIQFDLAPWKYSIFNQYGTYEAQFKMSEEETLKARFTFHEAGSITKVFRTFVTKPLLNLLIFITSKMPSYNLGFAVIILTIIIKLLLYFPTQHALEGQKRMQEVQPKLEEIKKKYGKDPEKLQKETMRVWKENKVNPFQSCLPILVQFPVLIGLFFVIRDGGTLELSRHLLYGFYENLEWTFNNNFFGLNLKEPNVYIFPPALIVTQFIQMKLSFALSNKKQKDSKDSSKKKDAKSDVQNMQQRMMLYGLPLMIGFFALKFPAAVSLYWGVSTIFAIGQQLIVNRKMIVSN